MTNTISSLQSLFQLSVALNLGFIGYISLSSDDLKREESAINDLILVISNMRIEYKENPDCIKRINEELNKINELKHMCRDDVIKAELYSRGRLRSLVLISAAVSLAMLVYASVGTSDAGILHVAISLLLFAPFIIMLVRNYSAIYISSKKIKVQRKKLEDEVADLIEALEDRIQ